MRILVPVLFFMLAVSNAALGDDAKLREEIGILRAEKQALEDRVKKLTEQLEKAQRVEAELTKLRTEISRGFNDMSDRIARLESGAPRMAVKPETGRTDDPSRTIARVDPATTTPTTTPRPTTTTPSLTPNPTPSTTTTPSNPAISTPTLVPTTPKTTPVARVDLPRIPDPVTPSNPIRPRTKVDRPKGTPTTVAMVDMVQLWTALKEKKAIEDGLGDLIYAVQFADQNWQKKIRELELDYSLLAEGSEAWLEKRRQMEAAYIERNVAIQTARTKLNRRRGELTKALYTKMVEAIGRVSDENGYDAVIFKEPEPKYDKLSSVGGLFVDRMVVVGNESVDLTEQVIRLMNREFERVGG